MAHGDRCCGAGSDSFWGEHGRIFADALAGSWKQAGNTVMGWADRRSPRSSGGGMGAPLRSRGLEAFTAVAICAEQLHRLPASLGARPTSRRRPPLRCFRSEWASVGAHGHGPIHGGRGGAGQALRSIALKRSCMHSNRAAVFAEAEVRLAIARARDDEAAAAYGTFEALPVIRKAIQKPRLRSWRYASRWCSPTTAPPVRSR